MPTHSSVSVYMVFMTLDCAIVKYFSTVDEHAVLTRLDEITVFREIGTVSVGPASSYFPLDQTGGRVS
jgi:hypothetical protein